MTGNEVRIAGRLAGYATSTVGAESKERIAKFYVFVPVDRGKTNNRATITKLLCEAFGEDAQRVLMSQPNDPVELCGFICRREDRKSIDGLYGYNVIAVERIVKIGNRGI